MGANAIKGGEPATIDYSLHAIVGFQFWRMLSKIENFCMLPDLEGILQF